MKSIQVLMTKNIWKGTGFGAGMKSHLQCRHRQETRLSIHKLPKWDSFRQA